MMKPYLVYVLAVSAVLLLVQLLRHEFDDTLRRIGRHWVPLSIFFLLCFAAAGSVMKGLGVPHLFRDDPDLTGLGLIMNSSVFWTQFGITILLFSIWAYTYHFDVLERTRDPGDSAPTFLKFVLIYSFAMAFYVVGAAALPWDGPWQPFDLAKGILGVLVAFLVFWLAILLIQKLVRKVQKGDGLDRRPKVVNVLDHVQILIIGPQALLAGCYQSGSIPDATIARSSGVARAVGFLILMWISLLLVSYWKVIQAGVSIVLLMGWVLLVLFFLGFLRPFIRFWIIVIVALIVAVSPTPRYKYSFPGLEQYYGKPVPLRRSHSADPKTPPESLLEPVSTLDKWRNGVGKDCSHLIIVATSGGAYRAAYWTAAVLDELERLAAAETKYKNLSNCIRLMTGASGGMVGAAYYVAMKNQAAKKKEEAMENEVATDIKGDHLRIDSVVGRLNQDTRRAREISHFPTRYPYSRDSLTPVAHQLIRNDIHPLPLSREPRSMDRGRVLEDQWLTLDQAFASFKDQEKEGRIPSLLVTPLAFWTETYGEGVEIKESFAIPLAISNLDTHSLAGSNGRQALVLFDLFPDARDKFKVNTAIRMNATFPYVSPAVALPTEPPVRVVDAGYYENYGIAAAANWLSSAHDSGRKETPLEWLKNEGLGVILIQIRAYPFDSSPLAKDRACPALESENNNIEQAPLCNDSKNSQNQREEYKTKSTLIQSLTSPLEAIIAVRDSGMNIRNNQQIALLEERVSGVTVHTVSFENAKDVGMSWYLIPEEVVSLKKEVKSDFNLGQWKRLLCLSNGKNLDECKIQED